LAQLLHQIAVAFRRKIDICLAGFLHLLLKAMQNVDSVAEFGDVLYYPKRTALIPDPYFLNTLANGRHWFPIGRHLLMLNLVQLIASLSTRRFWKRT